MLVNLNTDDVDLATDNHPFAKDVEEILHQYGTSLDGLSLAEYELRRARGIKNVLEEEDAESLIKKFMGQFTEPLIMLLLASAAVSIFMGQYSDATSIVLAVIIVSTVAFVQEYRSEKSVEALKHYVTHKCTVIRDGKLVETLAEELVQGDLLMIKQGDRVPADLRLIECVSLRIDESILTGEHKAVRKHPHALESAAASLSDRKNMAFMGTIVSTGSGKGVVVGVGNSTELGKISEMLRKVEERKTPLQSKMDQLGKHLSIFSFAIIAVIFFIGAAQGHPLLDMFNVGVSLAVAAIPEGLPIVVTVTLALGVTRMSKRNAIVRKLPAVEALGAVSVVCVDKTGTLTQNEMTVSKLFTTSTITVSHVGYTGSIEFSDSTGHPVNPSTDPHIAELIRIGLLCNNAQLDFNGLVGQPTEGALLALAFKSGQDDLRNVVKRVEEVPFDSETKWMAVRCQVEGRYLWYVKGSVEAVLPRCTSYYSSGTTKLEVMDSYNRMASEALRVIALAYGDDLHNLMFVGLAGIMDPPRRGVKEAIQLTRSSHIKVVMITGDSKETAIAIAKELGIWDSDSISLSCGEMESMSESDLSNIMDRVAVFYRMAPGHKMKIVNIFRNKGHICAMTGDGVNDAPALKMADIGIAMGRGGSDVCRESAEMILVDNNFSTIEAAIEEGKSIYTNIKSFLRFQLSTSVAALATTAICTLTGHPLPLNPMQILWINIIMDGPPAQSLTFEGITQDAIHQPPRNPNTPVIDHDMIVKIGCAATVMVFGTMYVFFGELGEDQDIRYSSSMAFTTFVMFQMFNAVNCRSKQSVLKLGLFSNKFFTLAIGGSIFMQLLVLYLPFLQFIFDTTALSFGDLFKCIIVGSTVLIMDEVWKMVAQQRVKEQRSL